jgi:hypothetical protein
MWWRWTHGWHLGSIPLFGTGVSLQRRELERALIAATDQFCEQLADAHEAHTGQRGHVDEWFNWARSLGLITDKHIEVWRSCFRIRTAILAGSEHDRTFASLRRHTEAIASINSDVGEHLAVLGDDNVRQLRRRDEPPS